jgi:glutaredoxin 3
MASITIYNQELVPLLRRRQELLDGKGAAFTEIDIEGEAGRPPGDDRKGRRPHSVPQIFIDGRHVAAPTIFMPWTTRANSNALLRA